MAATTITTNPALITAADGANSECTITGGNSPDTLARIEIITGTFSFNVGATATGVTATYDNTDSPIKLRLGRTRKLNFDAANAAETFKITFE